MKIYLNFVFKRSEEEASALRDLHIPEIIDKFDDNPVFPYNLHSDIHESRENDAEGNQDTGKNFTTFTGVPIHYGYQEKVFPPSIEIF